MDFFLSKGLDIPITGAPRQEVAAAAAVEHVALVAADYPGLRPSLAVRVGDRVAAGQELFRDKKNPGVKFTAPVGGEVTAVNRGERRRLLSVVIRVEGDQELTFPVAEIGPLPGWEGGAAAAVAEPGAPATSADATRAKIKEILLDSGLWTSIRTRPYGKVASPEQAPAALFVTAMETRPLAAAPEVVIAAAPEEFRIGLAVVATLTPRTWLCVAGGNSGVTASGAGTASPGDASGNTHGNSAGASAIRQDDSAGLPGADLPSVSLARFSGPHPAGLPSTHIHFLDPVGPGKLVWQIDYQDVIAIGHLFRTGRLGREKIIALAGTGIKNPRLVRALPGASLAELLHNELAAEYAGPDAAVAGCYVARVVSGSVLDGRRAAGPQAYLGRYHHQVSVLVEDDGSCLLGWLRPGCTRFSLVPAFLSALAFFRPATGFNFSTAVWGGRRAVFPLGTYERVLPLDLVATALLKSIAAGNSEKAMELGALELVEEDLALCSFVCPGKNDFGPMLRDILTTIEEEG